jgi:hypothetical protein
MEQQTANKTRLCPGCKQPLDACPYGGDCLEVQAIYRAEQREKLRDIDLDEIECEWCNRSYTDCCFDPCYGRADAALVRRVEHTD